MTVTSDDESEGERRGVVSVRGCGVGSRCSLGTATGLPKVYHQADGKLPIWITSTHLWKPDPRRNGCQSGNDGHDDRRKEVREGFKDGSLEERWHSVCGFREKAAEQGTCVSVHSKSASRRLTDRGTNGPSRCEPFEDWGQVISPGQKGRMLTSTNVIIVGNFELNSAHEHRDSSEHSGC